MAYDSQVLGGGDFVMEVLREAEQRVKRYLPAREREAFIERKVKEVGDKEGVGVGELRLGGQRQAVSQVRGKIGWILSREYGISLAEIARRLGVCTSEIAKALQKKERQILEV
jgi:DNA-directed RNA polymerase specialized sigma24 family protein